MGWRPRCQAGSSSCRTYEPGEELYTGSSSQLEVNIISGQHIKREKYVAQMLAYAVAWIREDNKLKTHVVNCDDLHPRWNANLHFIVSDAALNQEKGTQSALTIELYCQGRLRDTLLGTARVLLSTLSKMGKGYQSAQSIALQIRRPSGQPRGILNIGSIILDLENASTNVSPLLRSPHVLWNEQQKVMKLAPFREFQEICRRSFSVSRDDVLEKERIPTSHFALDDNSLCQNPSLDLMEAVLEEENEDEEEVAIEAIYRRLKALSRGNSVPEDGGWEDRLPVQMSTNAVEMVEYTASENGNKAPNTSSLGEPSIDGSVCGQSKSDQISSKATLPEFVNATKLNESIKSAIESLEKHNEKHFDKVHFVSQTTLDHKAKCKEQSGYPRICQDGLMAAKQDLLHDDVKVKNDKLGNPAVLVWKDLPLSKKKQLFWDEIIDKKDLQHCKTNRLKAIWGRRASWSLWKGAAKIHLSPSDK